MTPHFEPAFEEVSSSEVQVFEEGCEDDTVEVVVLNADDNYDDIDQHFQIEIQAEEALANESAIEKEVDDKLALQNVLKKTKKAVQNSTRQTRSSNTKSPKANKAKASQVQPHHELTNFIVKEEESIQPASCSTNNDVESVTYYEIDKTAEADAPPPSKKRRGRPKAIKTEDSEPEDNNDAIQSVKRNSRFKPAIVRKANDLPMGDADEDESDYEFPARDSDNEDWPAQTTLSDFPNKIIENGLLLVKGKKLMSMICKYYKLECDLCEQKTRFK